uniref:Uncharacterized protein n=1 Tax=Craspedostauros australis TaxID=1486917 RepID=A0A7R9WUQ4_9STRA
MCSDVRSLSNFCLLYSIVGAIFMGWVGIMLTHQPLFVGGIKHDEKPMAARNAYGACATFIFTFFLSVAGLFYSGSVDGSAAAESPRRRHDGGDYDGIPQSTMPSVLQGYATNLELPPSVQDGIY